MIEISQPHGYLRDDDDRVVMRFANWETGNHDVPDVIESVEYVDGPGAHEESAHEDYQDSY